VWPAKWGQNARKCAEHKCCDVACLRMPPVD
jgi:hypothetical protein